MVFGLPVAPQALIGLRQGGDREDHRRDGGPHTGRCKAQLVMIENHDTDRFASVAGGNPARERAGAAFDLFLRGTPLIYYGQELGMCVG